ncbi:MAG TPA: nuclear transport factor 2 family protein [Puia sp.]|nr:nuclear transport factor 2 family protein [Puia sp.]
MKQVITGLLLVSLAAGSQAQHSAKEKAVMAYYSGFEQKDWNAVADQLARGFTFTSPNNDDHIPLDKFKEKCWGTSQFFKKVDYINMVEKGNTLMLLVEIHTVDGKTVRNVDVYTFSPSGKIKSIEVFFGAGSKYPGNKG